MTYIFNPNIEKNEYEQFVSSHNQHSLLQSYNWSLIKNNWEHKYIGIYENKTLVATALILIKLLPLKQKFAYIPKGPIFDYNNQELTTFMFKQLKKLAKLEKWIFIRIMPNLTKQYTYQNETFNNEDIPKIIDNLSLCHLKFLGDHKNMHDGFSPQYEAITHINDEILESLPGQTTKFYNQAIKRGVEFELYKEEALNDFMNLINSTENKKQINLRDQKYFKKLLNTYTDSQIALACIYPNKQIKIIQNQIDNLIEQANSIKEKQPKKYNSINEQIQSLQKTLETYIPLQNQEKVILYGVLFIIYGSTIELLYAGTNFNAQGFNAHYFTFYNLLQMAKNKNLKYMNMGGVANSLDDGLSLFKSKFNPHFHKYLGEFDLINSPKYHLFTLAWKLRQIKRKH